MSWHGPYGGGDGRGRRERAERKPAPALRASARCAMRRFLRSVRVPSRPRAVLPRALEARLRARAARGRVRPARARALRPPVPRGPVPRVERLLAEAPLAARVVRGREQLVARPARSARARSARERPVRVEASASEAARAGRAQARRPHPPVWASGLWVRARVNTLIMCCPVHVVLWAVIRTSYELTCVYTHTCQNVHMSACVRSNTRTIAFARCRPCAGAVPRPQSAARALRPRAHALPVRWIRRSVDTCACGHSKKCWQLLVGRLERAHRHSARCDENAHHVVGRRCKGR